MEITQDMVGKTIEEVMIEKAKIEEAKESTCSCCVAEKTLGRKITLEEFNVLKETEAEVM